MNIIASELKTTIYEELFLAIFVTVVEVLLIVLLLHAVREMGKFFRVATYILTPVILALLVYGWFNAYNRSYDYEVIEAKVSDWNEIMNDPSYTIIERNDDWVKLEKKLEKGK